MIKFKFNKNTEQLFQAILSLKNVKEAESFFRDLCTIEEISAMSERWQIVQLLNQGISYRKISKITGSSTTTIGRVASWLNNGEGGYQLALSRIASHHNSSKISRKS